MIIFVQNSTITRNIMQPTTTKHWRLRKFHRTIFKINYIPRELNNKQLQISVYLCVQKGLCAAVQKNFSFQKSSTSGSEKYWFGLFSVYLLLSLRLSNNPSKQPHILEKCQRFRWHPLRYIAVNFPSDEIHILYISSFKITRRTPETSHGIELAIKKIWHKYVTTSATEKQKQIPRHGYNWCNVISGRMSVIHSHSISNYVHVCKSIR